MRIIGWMFIVSLCLLTVLAAEDLPSGREHVTQRYQDWLRQMEKYLKEWEESDFKDFRNVTFSGGARPSSLVWVKKKESEKGGEAVADIPAICEAAQFFLKSNLPNGIKDDFVVSGCQKLRFGKSGSEIWFVDVRISAQYYTVSGIPFERVICVPVDIHGNVWCEVK